MRVTGMLKYDQPRKQKHKQKKKNSGIEAEKTTFFWLFWLILLKRPGKQYSERRKQWKSKTETMFLGFLFSMILVKRQTERSFESSTRRKEQRGRFFCFPCARQQEKRRFGRRKRRKKQWNEAKR
jgi:hypothetical protein